MILIKSIAISTIFCGNAFAQKVNPDYSYVFKQKQIDQVKIILDPADYNWVFDPSNWYSNDYLPCDFRYVSGNDSTIMQQVGFRLRGNTSRQADKKSFKIKYGEYTQGQEFYDLKKLNLKGEHNDPLSFREHLALKILRLMNIPTARSSHVRVFINGDYRGVYTNVEQIDRNFLALRFGNDNGNLYKCHWGADLTNSNDVYDDGTFELETNKTDNDRSDLEELIDVLNNSTAGEFVPAIKSTLNVHGVLKYLVVEILLGHWDGYVYNKNNFYLYHNTETDLFEIIPYDPDNSLGVDWIGRDWTSRDVYAWQKSNDLRPLYVNLLLRDEFYKWFTEYLDQALNEVFNEAFLFDRIDSLASNLRPYVASDPYYPLDYGFDIDDYDDALTQQVVNHVPWGIKPYISQRNSEALQQLDQQALAVELNRNNKVIKLVQRKNGIVVKPKSIIPAQVKIYDLQGKLVHQNIYVHEAFIQMPQSGVYLVQTKVGKNQSAQKIWVN